VNGEGESRGREAEKGVIGASMYSPHVDGKRHFKNRVSQLVLNRNLLVVYTSKGVEALVFVVCRAMRLGALRRVPGVSFPQDLYCPSKILIKEPLWLILFPLSSLFVTPAQCLKRISHVKRPCW
jgi:hypothetical protein